VDRSGIPYAIGAPLAVGGLIAVSGFLDDYPLLGGQGVRYTIAAVALALYARATRTAIARPNRDDALRAIASAVAGMIGFNILIILAVDHADPATVGTIVGCSPLILSLTSPTRRTFAAAAIVVAGGAIVEGAGGASAAGILLALAALAGENCFLLMNQPVVARRGPLAASVYGSTVAAAIGLVLGAPNLQAPTGTEALALLYAALVATAFGFVCWYTASHRLGAARAGLFLGLIPVAAFSVGVILGNQDVDPLKGLGCAIVGAGIAYGISPGRERSTRSSSLPRTSEA
jgi:drug/metabolite transporter (DMT)-like permease